jgi:uncharacterized membrane protein HdeD (DUF308 family)
MSQSLGARTDVGQLVGKLGRSWGWLCAFGVLTLLTGLVALTWPGGAIAVLAVVFGVQLLVGGVFWLVTAVALREEGSVMPVALVVLLGVLAVIAGVLVLLYPFSTALALVLLLGAFWVVNGIIETAHAIAHRGEHSRGWAIASGVLSLLAGLALLASPGLGLVVLAWILGIWLIVYGAIMISRAFQLRAKHLHPAPRPAQGPSPA